MVVVKVRNIVVGAIFSEDVFEDYDNPRYLHNRVAEAINAGWQPLGGVSMSDGYSAQVMVKY